MTPEQLAEEEAISAKMIDAIGKAAKVAVQAAEASPERRAEGTMECPACGKTLRYSCSVPKRRRTFLMVRCETDGCLKLIT